MSVFHASLRMSSLDTRYARSSRKAGRASKMVNSSLGICGSWRVLLSKLGTRQAVETHAGLGCLGGQAPVNVGRNANQEPAAVTLGGHGLRNPLFPLGHIGYNIRYHAADAAKRRFRTSGKPAQAGKLRTEAGILGVFF
jgi:hypothetical protein